MIKLAKTINDLYLNKSHQGQLVFIFGDGAYPVDTIYNDVIIKEKAKEKGYTTDEDVEAFRWHCFENARIKTSSYLPTFLHYCIYRLLADNVVKTIITTNYDLIFDEIWRRNQNLEVLQNPVAQPGEYLSEGYRSYKNENAKKYYKLHGSLDYVFFSSKKSNDGLIFKLPRFIISKQKYSFRKDFSITTQAPHLGFEINTFPRTHFCDYNDIEECFVRLIDWRVDPKTVFKHELDSVEKILSSKDVRTGGIALIGFMGYHNPLNPDDKRNEEISPMISSFIKKNGYDRVFCAINQDQYNKACRVDRKDKYSLLHDLHKNNRLEIFTDANKFAHEFFSSYCPMFPIRESIDDYEVWRNYLYLNGAEE
jgi:hypothetical protein